MAFSERDFSDQMYYEDQMVHDLLRPGVFPNKFTSKEEYQKSLIEALSHVKDTLIHSEVLIFTLGLTEAWTSKDGLVYPVCPGVLNGVFEADLHNFINYKIQDVKDDINQFVAVVKKYNPEFKLILTVSPVPLTATATGNHVLPSSIYSKSVLRSAAGELSDEQENIDYFPSYEICSNPTNQPHFFSTANLRTITPEGVETVMHNFAHAIGAHTAYNNPVSSAFFGTETAFEGFCNEKKLDPHENKIAKPPSNIFLLCDSHMGRLSEELERLGFNHYGGMIMPASAWSTNSFDLNEDDFFTPQDSHIAIHNWSTHLQFFKSIIANKILITNIGIQSHTAVDELVEHFIAINERKINFENFSKYFKTRHEKKFKLLEDFRKRGFNILEVSDPPTHQKRFSEEHLNYFDTYEKFALKFFLQHGCEIFYAKEYFQDKMSEIYYSTERLPSGSFDWIHGSAAYYRDLGKAIIDYCKNKNYTI